MKELFQQALPLVPIALAPLFLLLLAPLCKPRTRTVFGTILIVIAVGFVVDVLVLDHSEVHELAVRNVFPRAPDGEPHAWTVATESAPAWQWHIVIALALGIPGLWLFARRKRLPSPPQPALYGAVLGLWWLALRLGLEKTAAHEPVVFAVGLNFALLLILPFVGWYSGLWRFSFKKFVSQLFAMAFLQRIPLIAFAYWATTRQMGTHLDTHRVTDIQLKPFGEKQFAGDATQAWIYTTLIPHATIWILVTVVAGIVLGSIPFLLVLRRARVGEPV